MLTRRSVLCGLLAAPIVVRAGLIMPVKTVPVSISQALVDYYQLHSSGLYMMRFSGMRLISFSHVNSPEVW